MKKNIILSLISILVIAITLKSVAADHFEKYRYICPSEKNSSLKINLSFTSMKCDMFNRDCRVKLEINGFKNEIYNIKKIVPFETGPKVMRAQSFWAQLSDHTYMYLELIEAAGDKLLFITQHENPIYDGSKMKEPLLLETQEKGLTCIKN